MAANRREEVKRLFNAALKRVPTERSIFLDGLGALDPSLRQEVEALLDSHDEMESFLEKPPPADVGDSGMLSVEDTDSVTRAREVGIQPDEGKRIGPYRILQELGHGGMGVVYEAEQEEPVHRRVALKLIKMGMDTKQVIARFEAERQAMALMTHANIARVFDAGATQRGRPYFAMEYVPGIPITEYCDKHRLKIAERLDLFMAVCDGVQHAHQKGIIHRDLKPSNVLITIQDDKPVPKIIDFGVAKATAQRLTERTVYTELGQLIGTPEYMSPEQAEMTGLDIDTRTDVFSLGVILYELLVGAQPFDAKELRRAGFDGMRRIIREEEPPKPSTRVSSLGEASTEAAARRRTEPATLGRQLRGDLDWITMKALEKDRTRRYGSPSELAADLVRHRKNEPVLASPPSTTYRVGKFVRRHKLGVAAAAGFVMFLMAFAVSMTVQSARIALERDRASREAAKAKAINDFLQETLGSADPYGELGREVSVIEALGEAVKKIEASFEDQPEIEAAVKDTIGVSYHKLGCYEEAEPLLASALEIRKATLGKEHLDVAESLFHLAVLRSESIDDDALIEKNLREALEIRRKLLGNESLEVAEVLTQLAWLRFGMAEYEESERLYRESLEIRRGILGDRSLLVADSLNALGVTLHWQGRREQAAELYREALDMTRRLGDKSLLIKILNNLALLDRDTEDYDTAEKYMREVLALEREAAGEDHPAVARSLVNLATVLNAKGDFEAAEPVAREALERRMRGSGAGMGLAAPYLRVLADTLTGLRRYGEAEPLYREAIGQFQESYGSEHLRTVVAQKGYGLLLVGVGRNQEAEHELLFVLSHYQNRFGEDAPRTQRIVRHLVELYEAWGKPENAAQYRDMLTELKKTEQ